MTNVIEIWKDVPGYEGFYQVSDTGKVRSIPRTGEKKGSTKYHFRILKPSETKRYLSVSLCRDSIVRFFTVHRLVATVFIDNPLLLPFVNHKDGVKNNNNVSNLEWVTPKQNSEHAVEIGLIRKGQRIHNSLLTDEQYNHIRTNLKHLKCVEIAKMYNINYFTMWDIIKQRKR